MTTQNFKHKPIYAGFPWAMTLRVVTDEAIFPVGSAFKADFRVNPNSPVLATVTTEQGGIVRVDDNRLSIKLSGSQSQAMLPGFVTFDLIRTDTTEHQHLGIRVKVPVEKSVTTA